jgi:hypothetical protein
MPPCLNFTARNRLHPGFGQWLLGGGSSWDVVFIICKGRIQWWGVRWARAYNFNIYVYLAMQGFIPRVILKSATWPFLCSRTADISAVVPYSALYLFLPVGRFQWPFQGPHVLANLESTNHNIGKVLLAIAKLIYWQQCPFNCIGRCGGICIPQYWVIT